MRFMNTKKRSISISFIVILTFISMSSTVIFADYYPHVFTVTEGIYGEVLEEIPGWSNMIVSKDIDDDDLIFTIDMAKPDPGSPDDILFLFLDYEADDDTNAIVMWYAEEGQSVWRYTSLETGEEPAPLPEWIQASRSGDVFTISIRRIGASSPFNGPLYRFCVITINETPTDVISITFPDIQDSDPIDSSLFEEETLPINQVIPETPFGTLASLLVMIGAFFFSKQKG
jgi:hypothetical protein